MFRIILISICLVLQLKYFTNGLTSVIVNNRQMYYNDKGELVETFPDVIQKSAKQGEYPILSTDNNFEKISENISAKNGDLSYLNEILNRFDSYNVTQKKPQYFYPVPQVSKPHPSNNYLNIITKNDYHKKPVYKPSKPTVNFVFQTTSPPPTPPIFYADDFSSQENFLNNTYEDIVPVKNTASKIPSQSKQQVVIIYATPQPPTTISDTAVKTQRPPMTEEDFLQNLNFFRKYFTLNCSLLNTPYAVNRFRDQGKKIPTSTQRAVQTGNKTKVASTKKPKVKKKTVLINPPIVGEVETIMESAYDFFENAFTDKEVVGKNKPAGKNQTTVVSSKIDLKSLKKTKTKKPTKKQKAKAKRKQLTRTTAKLRTITTKKRQSAATSKTTTKKSRKQKRHSSYPMSQMSYYPQSFESMHHDSYPPITTAKPDLLGGLKSSLMLPDVGSLLMKPDTDGFIAKILGKFTKKEKPEEMAEYHVHEHHYLMPGEEDAGPKHPREHETVNQVEPGNSNMFLEGFKAMFMMFTQLFAGIGESLGLNMFPGHRRRYKRDTTTSNSKVKNQVESYEDSYYYDDDYEDQENSLTKNKDQYSDEDGSASTSSEEESEEKLKLSKTPTTKKPKTTKITKPTNKPTTTKKVSARKTSRPKSQGFPESRQPPQNHDDPPWYYPTYFFVETSAPLDSEVGPIATPPVASFEPTTESSWFDFSQWFTSEDDLSTPETPIVSDNEVDGSPGWLADILSDSSGESITTPAPDRPPNTESDTLFPSFNFQPNKWLGYLVKTITDATADDTEFEETFKPTKVDYNNYQLWRLYPKSQEHVTYLEDYMKTPGGMQMQWWKGPSIRGLTDVLLPSHLIHSFKAYLKEEEILSEILIRDIQTSINYSNPKMSKRAQYETEVRSGHPLTFYRYHPHYDMQKFMEYMERKYPKNVELVHIGSTFEGRPLTVVKITASEFENDAVNATGFKNDKFMKSSKAKKANSKKVKKIKKKAVLIEAGASAREWLPIASSLWMIDYLVKEIDKPDNIGESIRSVDWYIMPILNPDGYEYSYKYDRLWKKSRSKHESSGFFSTAFSWLRDDDKKFCFGADLNRNFNYDFGEDGTSTDECSEDYGGPSAFSELETKNFAKFMMQNRKDIKLFISMHSYGQTISYSDEKESLFANQKYDDLMDMALTAVESLRSTGSLTKYSIDSHKEMSYKKSGNSDYFAKHVAGIKYSYNIELRDTGVHGFLLPATHIESSAKEAFQLIKGMVDYL